MSERVKLALVWIKEILDAQKVQYQIVGGLAVRIHGGSRQVADIDLYIEKSDVDKILPYVSPYISKPVAHYVEGLWDLEYFQIIYESQKIEIGLSPGTKIYSLKHDKWLALEIDYNQSVYREYDGVVVPIISLSRLVQYKRILGREVDLIDVTELSSMPMK